MEHNMFAVSCEDTLNPFLVNGSYLSQTNFYNLCNICLGAIRFTRISVILNIQSGH